jgi:hypothetical protein
MLELRANTAVDVLIGPFVDDTDGKTAETALTISQADVKLSKNGQALTQKNDDTAAAHDAAGYYNCELDATDTDTEGTLVLVVSESGALPVRHEFAVLSEAAWDSKYLAKDDGFMDVNVKAISEDTTAADTLELFAESLDQSTGQIDSGTLHDDTITAASINTGALTADAFAADAIVAATLATGCLTADAFAADAIVAATLATGAITADAFAADALVAATFATGALTADAFAANAIVAATLADDCITAAKINTGAITADAFAADALVAATFATGALTADALASTATDAIAAAAFQEWLTSEHVFYVVAAPPA